MAGDGGAGSPRPLLLSPGGGARDYRVPSPHALSSPEPSPSAGQRLRRRGPRADAGSVRSFLANSCAWYRLVAHEIRKHDRDSDGRLCLEELYGFIKELWRICGMRRLPSMERTREAFQQHDHAGAGELDRRALIVVLQQLLSDPNLPRKRAERIASPDAEDQQQHQQQQQPSAEDAAEDAEGSGWVVDRRLETLRRYELSGPVFAFECMRDAHDSPALRRMRMVDETHRRKRELLERLGGPAAGRRRFDWRNGSDLGLLHELFLVANEDGSVGLREDEFIALLECTQMHRSEAGDHAVSSQMQPRKLFLRIDTHCDGVLTWDEFSAFLLRGGADSAEGTAEEEESPPYVLTQASCAVRAGHGSRQLYHKGRISRIVVHPDCDRYYTAADDGTVKAWDSRTLQYETTVHDSNGAHLTDLTVMPNGQLIVAQRNRTIHSFQCTPSSTQRIRSFVGAPYLQWECKPVHDPSEPHGPLCQVGGMPTQHVTVGEDPFGNKVDRDGNMQVTRDNSHKVARRMLVRRKEREEYTALEELCDGVTVVCPLPPNLARIDGEPLLVGTDAGGLLLYGIPSFPEAFIRPHKTSPDSRFTWQPHTQEVTGLAVAVEKRCVISSSLDRTIRFTSLERGGQVMQLSTECAEKGGVLGFQSHANLQLIASFCGSAKVEVWDQVCIRTDRPRAVCSEHKEDVTAVLWVEKQADAPERRPSADGEAQRTRSISHLITLSSDDKTIKVWDTRNFRCMQTIIDKGRRWPQDALSSLAYDPKQRALIVGACSHLIAYRDRDTEQKTQAQELVGSTLSLDFTGHLDIVRAAVYSAGYEQLVTADQQQILVWDMTTGDRIGGFNLDAGVSKLRFDAGGRRLIVVTEAPCTIAVWDHLVGVKVKEFLMPTGINISCVVHCAGENGPRARPGSDAGSPRQAAKKGGLGFLVAGGPCEELIVWVEDTGDARPQVEEWRRLRTAGHGFPRSLDADSTHRGRLAVGTSLGWLLVYSLHPNCMDILFRINCVRPPEPLASLHLQPDSSLRRRRSSFASNDGSRSPRRGSPSFSAFQGAPSYVPNSVSFIQSASAFPAVPSDSGSEDDITEAGPRRQRRQVKRRYPTGRMPVYQFQRRQTPPKQVDLLRMVNTASFRTGDRSSPRWQQCNSAAVSALMPPQGAASPTSSTSPRASPRARRLHAAEWSPSPDGRADAASPTDTPPRSASNASLHAQQEAGRPVGERKGSDAFQSFSRFHDRVLQGLAKGSEEVFFLSADIIAVAQGSGEFAVWRLQRTVYELLAWWPATWQRSDPVTCACLLDGVSCIAVGDTQGVVSVFSLGSLLGAIRESECDTPVPGSDVPKRKAQRRSRSRSVSGQESMKKAQDHADQQPWWQLTHQHVRLVSSFQAHAMTVTTIAWVPQSGMLATAGLDAAVRLHHLNGARLVDSLGAARSGPWCGRPRRDSVSPLGSPRSPRQRFRAARRSVQALGRFASGGAAPPDGPPEPLSEVMALQAILADGPTQADSPRAAMRWFGLKRDYAATHTYVDFCRRMGEIYGGGPSPVTATAAAPRKSLAGGMLPAIPSCRVLGVGTQGEDVGPRLSTASASPGLLPTIALPSLGPPRASFINTGMPSGSPGVSVRRLSRRDSGSRRGSAASGIISASEAICRRASDMASRATNHHQRKPEAAVPLQRTHEWDDALRRVQGAAQLSAKGPRLWGERHADPDLDCGDLRHYGEAPVRLPHPVSPRPGRQPTDELAESRKDRAAPRAPPVQSIGPNGVPRLLVPL
eukprot:TRINITY_DN10767_c1_g1_i1.p1 TRINITY_DN10767_c1_g1~~TRINITY_DN10767_c1_g1_i1.p1  ORF type:complete len:1762 (+),score=443.52 TRINITY_DN10767_c1_g1_i1:73-5358(+)